MPPILTDKAQSSIFKQLEIKLTASIQVLLIRSFHHKMYIVLIIFSLYIFFEKSEKKHY